MHLLCWEVAGASTANSRPRKPRCPELWCSPRAGQWLQVCQRPAVTEPGLCWPCPGAAGVGMAAGSQAERAGMSAARQDVSRAAGKGLRRFLDLLFLVLRFVVFFFFYKTSPQEGV